MEVDVMGNVVGEEARDSVAEAPEVVAEEVNGMEKLAKLAERVVRDHAQEVLADTDAKVIIGELVIILLLLVAILLAWHCLGEGISELYTRERRSAIEKPSPGRIRELRSNGPGASPKRG